MQELRGAWWGMTDLVGSTASGPAGAAPVIRGAWLQPLVRKHRSWAVASVSLREGPPAMGRGRVQRNARLGSEGAAATRIVAVI